MPKKSIGLKPRPPSSLPSFEETVERLAARDLRRPHIDRARVEEALRAHLLELDHPVRPFRWAADAATASEMVGTAGRDAPNPIFLLKYREWLPDTRVPYSWGSDACEYPAHVAARGTVCRAGTRGHDAALDALEGAMSYRECARFSYNDKVCAIWRPLLDAYEAGLFLYWVTHRHIICVPSPALFVEHHALHRADGAAIAWPSGERYWFWNGIEVPRWIIKTPEQIKPAHIWNEPNLELRRCLVDRFGAERLVRELGAKLAAEDQYGRLWRCPVGENVFAVVEVENGTAEADGTRRRYWLRVPPGMRTPREAVAWTYGLQAQEYELAART
jgi:hypothetical protein